MLHHYVLKEDELYMHRCLQLAKLGQLSVAPNPMVGAVLVHEDTIIGEGYHPKWGEAHAEVACMASVPQHWQHLIPVSTLYVSLEPCAHFGKTPPCADLIVHHKIPKVVVGCRDPFYEVDGKGIEKLEAAGIEVMVGVLERECKELNKRFFTLHTRHRPYIVLKWAQSGDAKIGSGSNRVLISNEYTNRLVHRWRAEEASILVGTNTALFDDPELTTRLWPGNNPVRLVADMDLRLPPSLKLFNGQVKTIIFNKHQHREEDNLLYYQITEEVSLVHQICNALYHLKIGSVLVEGGARLLQSFIDEEAWDEARIITNESLIIGTGLPAPVLYNQQLLRSETIFSDVIRVYKNSSYI